MKVPRETTNRLIQLSRENKTSLTATLETLLAGVVFSHLPESTVDRVVSNGAISLRRFLPYDVVDDDKIGAWVTGYEFEHRRPKADPTEFSWSEARQVRQRIADELAKKRSDATSALLRWVSDIPKWFLEKEGTERGGTFEVSNLGVYKPGPAQSRDGGWNIGKMVFSQCGSVAGSGFSVSVVTGGDGCMTLAFSWLEGIVGGVWVENVIDSTRQRIDDLVSQ
ncbi:hypothetical protein BCR34DRAFT_575656 [Clohesyomyces aquaticus]|uniref:Uncharacterized protein n=1 Tax=Clohesyomyces aquaticus TaxID=1231657 RepID=A0A1Y1YR86_9PLEO|nr:hypothetical protein BCR34DRAFT_575656 [Clohesyomyces aquaticus]